MVFLTEYDWEASHFSKVAADESHDHSLPLDHDDVIIKAMPVQQHNEQEQVHVHVHLHSTQAHGIMWTVSTPQLATT